MGQLMKELPLIFFTWFIHSLNLIGWRRKTFFLN
ncbi:hypothetical protein MALU111345_07345 [Marinicrinis lubricantis]